MSSLIQNLNFIRPVIATALEFIEKMPGGSGSCRLECDKGKFVVKGNIQGRRVMVNELTSALLASLLTVVCPAPAIVAVTPEFHTANREVFSLDPGVYFGSQYLEGINNPNVEEMLRSEENLGLVTKFLAFDALVFNTDRKSEHFLVHDGHIYTIDHGHCLTSPAWTPEELLQKKGDPWPVWPTFKELLKNPALGCDIAALTKIDNETLWAILGEIPDEWGMSQKDKAAVIEFLLYRQSLLSQIVARTLGV